MARITVEDCLEKENNRFALVQLASKRTKQLLQGSHPLISDHRDNKSVVVSLREIADGKVRFMTAEEAANAEDELDNDNSPAALSSTTMSSTTMSPATRDTPFNRSSAHGDENGNSGGRNGKDGGNSSKDDEADEL